MDETKKEFSKLGRLLVVYSLIQIGMLIVMGIYKLVDLSVTCGGGKNISEERASLVINEFGMSGIPYVAASFLGMILVWLFIRKHDLGSIVQAGTRKMTAKDFGAFLICFMSPQILIGLVSVGTEGVLNHLGYTMMADLESMYSESETLSMIIYSVLIGPIAEEIIFRGVVLRSCEKYGKVFAILFSSIFFGVMHGSIIQGVFAALVGVVLAYVTLEYSIWWAVLIHIINNGASELFSLFSQLNDGVLYNVSFFTIFGGSLLFAIVFVCKNRSHIANYMTMYNGEKGIWKKALTRGWLIFYIGLNTFMALSSITPIK